MTRRLSIAQKIVLILIALLMLFSIGLTSMLITQANTELKNYQQRTQAQYFKQYELFSQFISERITGFIESFAGDVYEQQFNTNDTLQQQLQARADSLQYRWQVDNIWLVNDVEQIQFSSAPIKPAVTSFLINSVLKQQRPITRVSCDEQCSQYLGVPVLSTKQERVAVIGVEYPMAELMATFAQSAEAKIAIVLVRENDQKMISSVELKGQLTAANQQRFEALIAQLPNSLTLSQFYRLGQVITEGSRAHLINLLPLNRQSDGSHYLMTVSDISEQYFGLRFYYAFVIVSAIILSLCFIALVVVLLRGFRRKLENLSERLPLLAESRFEEFYDLRNTSSTWFEDELDMLENSADSLAHNLQKLSQQSIEDQIQLEKMAMFDSLTNLPNRSMLMFQIEKHIAALKRSNSSLAMLFLDVDDFKRINDANGHGVGDTLLKKVAKRITDTLRDSDIAARFGGDEFAILLTDVKKPEDATAVAKKLLDNFTRAFKINELTFFVNVSIGVALTEDERVTAAELLRHADIAMYEAKAINQSAIIIYDSAMNSKLMRRIELENEARDALNSDQFYLALQPKVDLSTARLVGFESLIRWQHPEKGLIPPDEFIPILEKTSLMIKLDYWVITRSMSLLSELFLNGYKDISIAINISAKQFVDDNLVSFLEMQLNHFNLKPNQVELELTETALVDDLTRTCEVMHEVRKLGCKIAIDDFGTGYSSLSYLKAMPADVVKIDRSFVSGMMDDQGDRNIVYSSISMVKGMGIDVVAEGIETLSQFKQLHQFECNLGQGYFISKPIPERELWPSLKKHCHNGIWKIPT